MGGQEPPPRGPRMGQALTAWTDGRTRRRETMTQKQLRSVVDLKATFADLHLQQASLDTLDKIGFEHPTPIQESAIPILKEGRDLIGQARTGTGKTAAFGLPFLERYDPGLKHVQGLVLAPTRELAIQIGEEMERYSAGRGFEVITIYGGTGYEGQEKALRKGVHMVVGTPGRIMDLMERGSLDLSSASYVVLDEADRMLDMGFIDDVEWILRRMPSKHQRQTMLFSATMPEEIKSLARRFLKQPEFVRVSEDQITVPEIEQVFYPVGRRNKLWALTQILDHEKGIDLMLTFCATKYMCDRLVGDLKNMGYSAEALHGDLPQSKREKVLDRFDRGEVRILIATDVAARGLDIDHITHVVNWDLPEQEPEVYVHRIGRTGRAGRTGKAISFVSLDDKPTLKRVEMLIGKEIPESEPPQGKGKLRRQIDWDELADKYGNIHIRLDAGRKDGLTPFKLHRAVQKATGLQDHLISDIRIEEDHADFAVPKDTAMKARNGVGKGLPGRRRAEFLDKETTVRSV